MCMLAPPTTRVCEWGGKQLSDFVRSQRSLIAAGKGVAGQRRVQTGNLSVSHRANTDISLINVYKSWPPLCC